MEMIYTHRHEIILGLSFYFLFLYVILYCYIDWIMGSPIYHPSVLPLPFDRGNLVLYSLFPPKICLFYKFTLTVKIPFISYSMNGILHNGLP